MTQRMRAWKNKRKSIVTMKKHVGLTESQIQEIVKGQHMGGYHNMKSYCDKKIEDIYDFAQDKAIYLLIQSIHDDDMIAYGSSAQK